MKKLIAITLPFVLSACAIGSSHQSSTQPIELRFAAQINGQAFECGIVHASFSRSMQI